MYIISLKQYGGNLRFVQRKDLIKFLLVPQILGDYTINYLQSDEVHGVYPSWFVEKWRYRDSGHLELKTDTS